MPLFEQLSLSPQTMQAVQAMGFTEATEIQAQAIPLVLEGRDVIGRSHTGTGKTAAFGLPVIERLDKNLFRPQVIILSPTRELAMQICEEMRKFARFLPYVKFASLCGGQPMDGQMRQLKTANVVVGTPGRVMDHMRRRTLKLKDIRMVVLDEADEMLNMGFYEDITSILQDVPEERQTLLFSATMPPAILKLTKEFQKDPVLIEAAKGERTLAAIKQYYYHVPSGKKIDLLSLLLCHENPGRSMVFCNTKRMVDEVVETLNRAGVRCAGLHGDMKQSARTRVMDSFKSGRNSVLVATDVAARGIDVENVEAVFNFDIPSDPEIYIHRIGRTGRAGKEGAAYSFACNAAQVRLMRSLSQFAKCPILQQPIPSVKELEEEQRAAFLQNIKEEMSAAPAEDFSAFLSALEEDGLTARQAAQSLLSLLYRERRHSLPDIPQIPEIKAPAPSSAKTVKLRLNIGRNVRLAPNFIVGAMVDGAGLRAKDIGKIDIRQDNSTVELSPQDARQVMDKMEQCKIKGAKVKITMLPAAPPRFDTRGRPPRRRPKTT